MLVVVFASTLTTPQDVPLVGIVPGALLVVGEDLVGSLDFGEEGGGALDVAVVAVGVQLEGLFAICLLESRSRLEEQHAARVHTGKQHTRPV